MNLKKVSCTLICVD